MKRTLFAIVLAAVLLSCKKEAEITEVKNQNEMALESQIDESEGSGCIINLSNSEIALIGIEHNHLLRESLDLYISDQPNGLLAALNQVFDENDYPTFTEK